MRKIIIAAAVAVTTISLAAPSEAGGFSIGFGNGHYHHGWSGRVGFAGSYYDGPYYSDYYEPYCFIRKVKRHDRFGNFYIRRVRICR
ncbi:hypothetical protein ILFOPFJJ_02847 [Ensifer psoraleae]|uniref:hypothetical protein n=1 Tax=Sinorhizobium psoraleae TaxID=520838 RepID=UPI001569DEE0|nr:hypothetical protein [Sinorhizobium psoraleae]NRP71954.1 hypothetical protein [Sinorhizobium psoraleae]